MIAPKPENEDARLKALYDLGLLDTGADAAFDALVRLAAKHFDAPIALVSLVDENRQWFKARYGLAACETCRDDAFCAHAILGEDVFIVENALEDERFCDNPLVLGGPNIRFYAGAPLILDFGIRIGTFCIIDTKPRSLNSDEIAILKDFALQALALIKMHDFSRKIREKAEKLVSINKELLLDKLIIENMSEGMSYQDKEGNIISVNPSACRIMGISKEQYLSQDLRDKNWKVTDEDGNCLESDSFPAMISLATGVAINNITIGVEKPEGEKAWIRVSAQPVRDENSGEIMGVVTTFSDISESKSLEAELRIKTREAEVANKTKSKFLANMSHEIRTPLNGVIGMASVLEKTNLDDKQREMIDLMLTSGRSLERLLSDILDLSKVDAGQIELENRPFSINNAISDVVNVLRYRADEKGLDVVVNIDSDKNDEIMGDVLRFKQIISNLTSNAIKFTDSGSVTLDIIHIEPDILEIRVTDTGIGMDDETIVNVFNRFTQADASISRRFGGSGLGLSISKGLIEIMGGKLSAKSAPNTGTCFKIVLPIIPAHPNSLIENIEPQREASAPMPTGLNLLLVEDHLVNQKVFQMMVEPLGFSVVIANNGVEGIEAFKAQQFDIVFMDIQMPVMDGLEATRLIREIEHRTHRDRAPIIALSANAGKSHIEVALNSGADDYLTKPMDFGRLCEILSQYLGGVNPENSLNAGELACAG